ncbi:MAG: hypothetical protein IJZ96_00700 [Lachnospiraceae bacterium]|nr:hypothetical protein [Lachnospiraceae bacterium]
MASEFKYFKKTKMYQLLALIVGKEELELMRYASYKFYRGSEWLYVGNTNMNVCYELYRCKGYVSLDIKEYCEDRDTYECVERKCYKAVNSLSEAIYCAYSRSEV